MKSFLRLISMVLAIVTVLAIICSCADNKDNGEEENTTTTSKVVSTSPYEIGSIVPADVRFDDEKINIVSRDGDWVGDELTIDEGYSGGVSDSIYERQLAVEEKLGVEIVNEKLSGGSYVVSQKIRDEYKSQLYNYDILANSVYSTIMYTGEGIMQDLGNCQYLDLTRPYWSQGFNEVASIGTEQYMCTGAAALTLFRYMFVTMFNKDLVHDHDGIDLYDIADNGEWTLDYQLQLCEKYADTYNGEIKEAGTYGFVSTNMAYIDPYWSSCKITILDKNSDNWYEYSLDIDRFDKAIDKIISLYNSKTNLGSYVYASASTDAADQLTVATHFAEGRAATITIRLASVESSEIRDMKDEYGIIPMPKYNKKQDKYYTYLHDQFTAYGVYSLVPEEKLPMIGAFLDVLAAESYRIVMPAYYELALKNRYLKDEQSARMLDLIYTNIYIDAGVLYTKLITFDGSTGVHQMIRTIVKSGQNSVNVKYGPAETKLKGDLKTMQDAIALIQA